MRLRTAHVVVQDDDDVPALLYDLERTFVIEIPDELRPHLHSWPPDPKAHDALSAWLVKRDLLTEKEAPDWRDSSQADALKITDVSLDLPGACNMGCRYCFEKPLNSRIGRMHARTLEASLDFAFDRAADSDHVAIHFGSGEPLIEIGLLRNLVEDATARAKVSRQELTFELTTNATLVTEEIAIFLAEHPFNVRVSCDGPAEIHDANRPMLNGRSSYALVERGLKILLEHLPDRLTINTVLCAETRLRTVWRWAKDLGLRHFHAIKVGSEADAPEALRASELKDFEVDLREICDDMFSDLAAGRSPIDYQPITKIVRRLMIPAPITRFCGVAGSYVGVASDGRVYPCFRHLGLEEYELGSVFDGIDDDRRVAFRNNEAADVDRRPGCQTCWARYMCGGGCYADSVVYGPDKLRPKDEHCNFWRSEIAAGIRFYHRLREADPTYVLALFGDDPATMFDQIGDLEPAFARVRKTF